MGLPSATRLASPALILSLRRLDSCSATHPAKLTSTSGRLQAESPRLAVIRPSGVCRLPPTGFVVRFRCVDILPSALRHGVDEADIDHAIRQAAVVEEVGQDPTRYLVIGPDRSGNLLELIVMDRPQGAAVIHAMALRAKYRLLLPPGESR